MISSIYVLHIRSDRKVVDMETVVDVATDTLVSQVLSTIG